MHRNAPLPPGSVECRWCGAPTYATRLRECNACWELRTRIETRPGLALRMLRELEDVDG